MGRRTKTRRELARREAAWKGTTFFVVVAVVVGVGFGFVAVVFLCLLLT